MMINRPIVVHRLFIASLILSLIAPFNALADDALWNQLKTGGMVVLMRHTSVEQGKEKGNSLLRDASCAKERNLSTQGKTEAGQIGHAFKERSIPIGKVLASPYCRTMDSAKLAFGKADASESLSLIEGLSQEASEHNTTTTSAIIGGYTGETNLVLVTHQPNIDALTFEMIEKGEFLVLKPMGGEKFEVLGKIGLTTP